MDIAGENEGKDANLGQITGERMEGKMEDTTIQSPMDVENQVEGEIEEERIMKY